MGIKIEVSDKSLTTLTEIGSRAYAHLVVAGTTVVAMVKETLAAPAATKAAASAPIDLDSMPFASGLARLAGVGEDAPLDHLVVVLSYADPQRLAEADLELEESVLIAVHAHISSEPLPDELLVSLLEGRIAPATIRRALTVLLEAIALRLCSPEPEEKTEEEPEGGPEEKGCSTLVTDMADLAGESRNCASAKERIVWLSKCNPYELADADLKAFPVPETSPLGRIYGRLKTDRQGELNLLYMLFDVPFATTDEAVAVLLEAGGILTDVRAMKAKASRPAPKAETQGEESELDLAELFSDLTTLAGLESTSTNTGEIIEILAKADPFKLADADLERCPAPGSSPLVRVCACIRPDTVADLFRLSGLADKVLFDMAVANLLKADTIRGRRLS